MGFLKAIPKVLPTNTDWSIIQTCKEKKYKFVSGFKLQWKTLFLR
jgi:hypothetical protein